MSMLALVLTGATSAAFSENWAQGINYFLIQPAQPTSVAPGKVEVTEVFSYACPACNHFYPAVDKLRAALPPNAELTFVPASFNPQEDWPMFQKAFYAAQALGIEKRTHDAVFDAVWKTGELGIVDPNSNRLKVPAPTLNDAANWYAKTAGIKADAFIQAANSFGVDAKTRQADNFIRMARVDQTPTLVVNGKYRMTVGSAAPDERNIDAAYQKLIDLVLYLVKQESAAH
jgi:thiol:disulfide interchange protein DsbA